MDKFQVVSPVDGSIFAERRYDDDSEIQRKLDLSKQGQKNWKRLSLDDRKDYCEKAVAYLVQEADAIGAELTWQMGRPIRYTPNEVKSGLKERAHHMIDIAEASLADMQSSSKIGFHRYIKRAPLGLVLVLAPWNYPYLTSVNAIIPALMAGNSVILKHAKSTPLCAERYAEAFEYAGLPQGVFQFIHATHQQIAKIINKSEVDYVAFTGSVSGGEAIEKALSGTFISSGLELGGKDPAYVAKDANLSTAIENLVDGAFFNSGQSCCGVERIYVHQQLYDDFVHGFAALTNNYKLSNPFEPETTLGPMINVKAKQYVQKQIDMAVTGGARLLIDNQNFPLHHSNSAYMAPQVLVNVNHQMEIMKEESFGPVVGIMPVASDEEAIRLMNDSNYGLTASIWTNDIERAKLIGEDLETGTVFMNRCDYLDPELAWTGVKNSGRGCTLSSIGYEALTRPKSFHLKLKS